MEQSYILHLSPDDSRVTFPTNSCTDFIVELDKPIKLPPDSFVEMLEIRAMLDDRSRDTIYVLSDICQNSIVFATQAPVLRAVTIGGLKRVAHEFTNPYKIKVSTGELRRCHIYLRGRDFKELSFNVAELEVTLRITHEALQHE